MIIYDRWLFLDQAPFKGHLPAAIERDGREGKPISKVEGRRKYTISNDFHTKVRLGKGKANRELPNPRTER